MFKFDVIESHNTLCNIPLKNLIQRKIKFLQEKNIIFEEPKKATFIVTEGRELSGGACLIQKEIKQIHSGIRSLVTNLIRHQDSVWECSGVYLETSSTYPPPGTLEFHAYCQTFYRELYEEFVAFGKNKKICFIIMRLGSEVYTSTKEFGLWPYVVELKPETSSHLFHGILPLTGGQYEAYKNTWNTLKTLPLYENPCPE